MKLLVATGNAHKLEEFRRILTPLGIQVLAPADLNVSLDVEETGTTFAENARIKAVALRDRTGYGVVADDSGLCVDALDGRPGVHSARYLGEDTPHTQKIAGLLRELEGVPADQRTARFVAAICCVTVEGEELTCQGACEGHIAFAPSGEGGFGYDPIFLVGDKSFGQLTDEEKDKLSHRGKALAMLTEQIKTKVHRSEGDCL